jgi:uncharacterized protein (DUF2336 family)
MGSETDKKTAEVSKRADAAELEALVELARDKSTASRSRLATVISDLYLGQDRLLSDADRQIMCDIIHGIIQDVEISVRKALAERLATVPNAHLSLLNMLANDDIEVAHPILIKSEVMRDTDLIEVVQYRTMEHQMAVAMRPTLSAPLSTALIKTGNQRVITCLLENLGATIDEDDLQTLVEQTGEVVAFQNPLAHRQDLPPVLAKKLFWSVSAALREHLIANYDLDAGELDEKIETTVKGLLGEDSGDEAGKDADRSSGAPAGTMSTNDFLIHPDQATWLMGLLRAGEVSSFLLAFGRFSRLRVNLLRRILFEPGGQGLAVICKAIGLDKPAFGSILVQFRHGRLGDKSVETDEITRALAFYEQTTLESATAVLRRWQRDPEYQNALRIVSNAGEGRNKAD